MLGESRIDDAVSVLNDVLPEPIAEVLGVRRAVATGDYSEMTIYLAVMLLSLLGLFSFAGMAVYERKKRR